MESTSDQAVADRIRSYAAHGLGTDAIGVRNGRRRPRPSGRSSAAPSCWPRPRNGPTATSTSTVGSSRPPRRSPRRSPSPRFPSCPCAEALDVHQAVPELPAKAATDWEPHWGTEPLRGAERPGPARRPPGGRDPRAESRRTAAQRARLDVRCVGRDHHPDHVGPCARHPAANPTWKPLRCLSINSATTSLCVILSATHAAPAAGTSSTERYRGSAVARPDSLRLGLDMAPPSPAPLHVWRPWFKVPPWSAPSGRTAPPILTTCLFAPLGDDDRRGTR